MRPMLSFFAKTSIQGAQTTIHCAVSDEIPNQSGSYYEQFLNFICLSFNSLNIIKYIIRDCKIAQSSQDANNKEYAAKLWKISAEFVGLDE